MVGMSTSRNPRNVQIYNNAQQPPVLVAGFMQLGHTTVFELYACLEICFQQPPPGEFRLSNSEGVILSRTNPNVIVPITDYAVVSLSMHTSLFHSLTSSGSSCFCRRAVNHRNCPAPQHLGRHSQYSSWECTLYLYTPFLLTPLHRFQYSKAESDTAINVALFRMWTLQLLVGLIWKPVTSFQETILTT